MKHRGAMLIALGLIVAGSITWVDAAQLERSDATPMSKVATLLRDMQGRIEVDGKMEQMSYDKFACWTEATLARKSKDIADAKRLLEELAAEIVKLKAEIASHGAELKQLNKDIAANKASTREATDARESENGEYAGDKTESEQCTGALEAAITAMTGAGEGKKKSGFLETMKEAQLISMAASVRGVLDRPRAVQSVSEQDLKLMHQFVEKPGDFVGTRASGVSAAQVGNNPFGDYAPQSTQIQGILKGMYDTFVADMEKGNSEEADAQKSYEALMRTKLRELATLEKTHEQHTTDKAEKSKKLADDMELEDNTRKQLKADEKFFEETKKNGQVKAQEWSERSRLRTEELQGVMKAIQILSSQDATDVFGRSTTTFIQLTSAQHRAAVDKKGDAYGRLSSLARRFHSIALAELAVSFRSGGHFDKVMQSIDAMIAALRREEQADIEHRDRCQGAQGKNKNDMEDISHDIGKAELKVGHYETAKGRLEGMIEAIGGEITNTKADMKSALDIRNGERAEFIQALKDDQDALTLLQQAMATLTRFYEKNRISMSMLATSSKARSKSSGEPPEYTVDPDVAPETEWEGGDYGGRSSETHGIVQILESLIEDLQNEVKISREDEAKAQQLYLDQRASMKESLDAQITTKIATEKDLDSTEKKLLQLQEHKEARANDLTAEENLEKAIYSDCSWVDKNFVPRREKRKNEIAGLQEAKGYLAGAESGQDVI